jgi:type IV secretion system protein VirB10
MVIDPKANRSPQDDESGFPDFGGDPPEAAEDKLDAGAPAVATSPKKIAVIIAVLLGLMGYVLINIFSDSEKPQKKEDNQPKRITQPAQDDLPPPPPPPPPPPQPEPEPVIEKSPLVPEKKNKEEVTMDDGPNRQAMIARVQSESVIYKGGANKLFGGGSKTQTGGPQANSLDQINDPNSAFALRTIGNSQADRAIATHIGPAGQVIAQGKMIDCVLETAISTDLPGSLRAVVSHDIYAEGGLEVLIPKGSRLIGTYNTGVLRGQDRVFIVWTRVIRPDGVDIMIGSEGTDALGRAGVKGAVDNKFLEIFSSAILTSSITLGVAAAVQAMELGGDNAGQTTRRTFTDGSSEDTADPTAIASTELVTTLGSAARDVIKQYIDVRPTITIDQGTRIKVFVNRDLQFPNAVTQQVNFVR